MDLKDLDVRRQSIILIWFLLYRIQFFLYLFFFSSVLLVEIHCFEMRRLSHVYTGPTCYCNRVIPSSSSICHGTCFLMIGVFFSSFLSHIFQRALYIYRSYLLQSRISSIRCFSFYLILHIHKACRKNVFIGFSVYYMSMNSPNAFGVYVIWFIILLCFFFLYSRLKLYEIVFVSESTAQNKGKRTE